MTRGGLLVVLAVAAACQHVSRRELRWLDAHHQRCEGIIAGLRPGPGFEAAVLQSMAIHPHGGRQACTLVGLAPAQWTRIGGSEVVYVDLQAPDPTYSGFTVEHRWPRGREPGGDLAAAIERDQLAPARKDAIVERDEQREHGRLLITRRSGAVRLLSIRWHPDGPARGYLRCEAYLFGRHEGALPAFEAACAAVRSMRWELPDD